MTALTSVLVVIDTKTIASFSSSPSQDSDHPTFIPDELCALIAPQAVVTDGLATAHLTIDVDVGKDTPVEEGSGQAASDKNEIDEEDGEADIPPILERHRIRWRTISLSGNSGQSAVIYRIINSRQPGHTGPATAQVVIREYPVPILQDSAHTDPPSYSIEHQHDYFIDIPVRTSRATRFLIQFYITGADEDDGMPSILGYFQWSASITLV